MILNNAKIKENKKSFDQQLHIEMTKCNGNKEHIAVIIKHGSIDYFIQHMRGLCDTLEQLQKEDVEL